MEFNFSAHINRFDHDGLWHFHLKVPDEIAIEIRNVSSRVVCTLNNKISYQSAVLSAGKKGYFININKEIREKLGAQLHDEIQVYLTLDQSKYGLPVPDVFQVLLQQDPEFDAIFHQLTSGKQRTLLHLIGGFKSEAKQLEKLIILRNYLVQVEGKLDFKEMNEAFKRGL